jgi:LysM repeat protein
VPDEKVAFYEEMAAPSGRTEKNESDYFQIPADRKKVEHVVQSGESPFVIAQKYDGVTPEAILQWNHIDNARKIQIGQTLILYIPK